MNVIEIKGEIQLMKRRRWELFKSGWYKHSDLWGNKWWIRFKWDKSEIKADHLHKRKVASFEEIEEEAKQYFENKYPLMDLNNDNDKNEIDWCDMIQFVQHILSNRSNNKNV